MVIRVSFLFSLCKCNCQVPDVIHLKCIMVEQTCFECYTFEMQKYRVAESSGISVTLVVSGGVMALSGVRNGGTTPEDLPTAGERQSGEKAALTC